MGLSMLMNLRARRAAGQARERGELSTRGGGGARPPRHQAFSELSANAQKGILEKSLPQEDKVSLPSPY